MVTCRSLYWTLVAVMIAFTTTASAQQQPGAIRGVVSDRDFDTPLAAAVVTLAETGLVATTNDQGNFALSPVLPGKYTLVFSKDGYVKQVKSDVVVTAGQLTDVDVSLSGEFTEMDEFLVQDFLKLGGGTEAGLLRLRAENPALMDSIGADLMSRAGVGDAAAALRLVAGASLQGGKFAVIRGLPDRYVSSQMNGVRLPTADADKRAVELDQFPAAVIESIQVSKTFTPDQQGDASGGAVDVRLRGIPDQAVFQLKAQLSTNSQSPSDGHFITYDGGGVSFLGRDRGNRDIQEDNLGGNWTGAAGVRGGDAPANYKWSLATGGKHELDSGVKLGAFASLFYKRESTFYDNGQNNSFWVTNPGGPLVPQSFQGTPSDGDFKTALFDVTKARDTVQWGGLGTLGVESENHSFGLTYLYTRTADDTATLAQDTRGKAHFFPGYDPNNPTGTGNTPGEINSAPYIRTETLEYTERSTQTLQLGGKHKIVLDDFGIDGVVTFKSPEIDWTASHSTASLDQPDKRQFAALWTPAVFNPGAPPFVPPFTTQPTWSPYKPASSFNLGNFQRIWKDVHEESDQLSLNVKFPFEQWSGESGYVKAGVFDDHVSRKFNQDTFANFGDASTFVGDFDEPWSAVFPSENHPITASEFDVDYDGSQDIHAKYAMVDLPLSSKVTVIGGARFESTSIGIVNKPDANATWFPPGATAPVDLHPGDADVDFSQDDVLPSLALEIKPLEAVTVRTAYSRTVARQTFKELTPILQQEFAGGPVFIGNPELGMSALTNYDLRADYTPYPGGLISVSWFRKDIDDPIEYVQKLVAFTYTTPVNYPKGRLSGFEFEVRQDLGVWTEALTGLACGANATFIESEVTLTDGEIAGFSAPNIQAPMRTRDMTNAPEHLYNLYLTYDIASTGTQFGLFYTVQGDTLVAGAAQSTGNFVPSIYAKEYDTLNFSLSQKLGEHFKLQFQAKNLTNPAIEEVYRSRYIDEEETRSSSTRGIEYSLSLSADFAF